jgi:hypothetical protein
MEKKRRMKGDATQTRAALLFKLNIRYCKLHPGRS